ncbi:MAG: hypothetical protein J6R18_04440 [Kiritimatiellae bacterium]|nr:hypothetical protein [Kiritimatiellia bacterium]
MRKMIACACLLAAFGAIAADLPWIYEGASPEPATSSLVSAGEDIAAANASAVSALYGATGTLSFFTFFNSVGAACQATEFLSTPPRGLTLIIK